MLRIYQLLLLALITAFFVVSAQGQGLHETTSPPLTRQESPGPKNGYLSNSMAGSHGLKNVYDGVVSLNERGEAIVEMPHFFGVSNRDFRYFLTPVGASMPGLYIAEELTNNRFKISGGLALRKVSWQVTAFPSKRSQTRTSLVRRTNRKRSATVISMPKSSARATGASFEVERP